MTEIRLDSGQVERIIAQVLRDQYKMLPAVANEAALAIGTRLISSLPTPNTVSLKGMKVMSPHPPFDFRNQFSRVMKQSGMDADTAWDLVYQNCKAVPAVVADSYNYKTIL